MAFEPDYRHFDAVMQNTRPKRLPLYEHCISPLVMEKILGVSFANYAEGEDPDLHSYFEQYCRFFYEMSYDVVSFEFCIAGILPGHGALFGGRPGPIQNREDFDNYPWDDIPRRFAEDAIAPFDTWISKYGGQIGLLGGFDMDFLCTRTPEQVYTTVIEAGTRYRETARGFALGSGNSIPSYVPVENYLAMIEAAKAINY